jgi:hypothetical protein
MIIKISNILNTLYLLQNLVGFKLLSKQLDLVTSIKEILFNLVKLVLKRSILCSIAIKLIFEV